MNFYRAIVQICQLETAAAGEDYNRITIPQTEKEVYKLDAVLENFIQSTGWPMEPPPAYGAFHLTFTFVGLALSLFFAWKLRNVSEKGHRVLLFSVGIFLALCEIYKQLFYYYQVHDHEYPWWIFPFQMCSVPMYLCLIVPWRKTGKVQRGMYGFMMTYNLLGGLMAFIEPSGIVHEYWTLTLHAFIWHMSLVFLGLYLGFSKHIGKTAEDFKLSIITYLVLCVIAFGINLLLWEISGGSVNNFYIGPSNSPLAVFKSICEHCGWFVNTLVYIPAVSLGAFLLFLPFHLKNKSAVKA